MRTRAYTMLAGVMLAVGLSVAGSFVYAKVCRTCGGTGLVQAACSDCNGTGQCSTCGGKGRRPSMMAGGSSAMCLACKGSGMCKKCGGTGTDPAKKNPCPDCGGPTDKASAENGNSIASSVPADVKTVACSVCKGSGRLSGTCPMCGGSKVCRSCEGYGRRESSMKGGRDTMCIACKGSGKCKDCNGTGVGEGVRICAICEGTGRMVVESYESMMASQDSTRTSADPAFETSSATGSAPKPAAMDGAGSIDDYVKTMANLDQLYAAGKAKDVSFTSAWQDRPRLVGALLKSTVYLLSSHVRGVRVAATSEDVKNGNRMIMPRSLAVSKKADKLLKDVGECGKVIVTYGVVNADNLTLFDIETCEGVQTPTEQQPPSA